MKRGAAAHPHLDVNATSLRATCGQFRYAPARFEFPAHRSVNPGDVAAFANAPPSAQSWARRR